MSAEHHDHAPIEHGDERPGRHEILTTALKELLIEKGYFTGDDLRATIETLQAPEPAWGARMVARAWVDPGYRDRLLTDGTRAAAEMGVAIKEAELVALENTADVHNLVVCTLCSCYPRSLLGQPPPWYTAKPYRARAVSAPRQVMAELGYTPPDDVAIRVHDSNADLRYLVVPMRPAGTDHLDEAGLADLVTRDSMIGTAPAAAPS